MKLYFDDDHIYDLVEGSIYTKNYNETLDSANVRISHLTGFLNIEPFDKVQLLFNNDRDDSVVNPYMLIDSFECIEEGLDDKHYTYEINLFSCVKQLENILLPNIAITPLQTNKRSIYYYLEQYLNEYGDGTLQLDSSVQTRFSIIDCPEMQWNTPTLREVFDALMMVDDCICTIDNDTIKYMDLTEKGAEISDYNYIKRSRSSQDYVSEIKMNLQNAMEDNSTIKTEIIPYSAISGYTLTSDNYCVKTQFPIKKINHFWLNLIETASTYKRLRVDLMTYLDGPLVLEYDAYKLLEVKYFKALDGITIDHDIYKYQNFCLYYQRYSNVISGFTDKLSTTFESDYYKIQVIRRLIYDDLIGGVPADRNEYYTSFFFEIEYETNADLMFAVSKINKLKNKRTIMDNQTNSFVNTKVQAELEYQKVNRLGNEQLLINQRVDNISNAIQLKQTYNDSIVYQTQYQCYSDHIEVNALATKNYILQNYFTGVKSHIRTWVNAKDEAITRHELIKDRYELSYSYDEIQDYSYYLSVALTGGQAQKIRYCMFTPLGVTNAKYFVIDCISRVLGISAVFSFGCEDNTTVYSYFDGSKIDQNSITVLAPSPQFTLNFLGEDGYGGVPIKAYKYVDNNFENSGIRFWLSDFDITNDTISSDQTLDSSTNSYQIYSVTGIINYMLTLYNSPVFPSNLVISKIFREVNFHKDNKEISKYSYQIEFGVDDINNLYLSETFVNRQAFASDDLVSAPVFYKANKLNSNLPNDAVSLNASISIYRNAISIELSESDIEEDDFIYVCENKTVVDDNNNVINIINVIIAAKYNSTHATINNGTVYFHLYLNKEE